jgi:sec-independent protein translocase protein TatA
MGLDNPIHIAFLLIVLLMVFGAKRLPEMGRSLGTGMRGFKDALGGESLHEALGTGPAERPVAMAAAAQPTVVEEPVAAPVREHVAA